MGQHSAKRSTKRRILIVEDHADTAELVSLILQDAGYSVRLARNADTALTFLTRECEAAQECPDLVLLDLTMSGKDPLQMVAEVGPAKMPPVVIISARQSGTIAEAAGKIGAAGVIHKPFDVNDLLSSVQRALS
jgi:response regulator NasT